MSHNISFQIWLDAIKRLPSWEVAACLIFACMAIFLFSIFQIFLLYRDNLFHAFENIKIKLKDFQKQDSLYLEITIPKNSETTAFQIQQKVLKAFHSVYQDPIDGHHKFSQNFYFFQKLFRLLKLRKSAQVFFSLQIWAEYPYISFRIKIPKAFFERLEKAIFNAYPHAEIALIDESKEEQEITKYQKSYLAYGQSSIEGNFEHRIKTFKDLSSDPVNSMIATMEALPKGQYMVLNLTVVPMSHYFNQIIHYLIDYKRRQKIKNRLTPAAEIDLESVSALEENMDIAEAEKMKASLFKCFISYWAISNSRADAESKLSNIQAVLTEVNQKNMNTLKHKLLFTKQVEELQSSGQLKQILNGQPVLKQKGKYWPFGTYKNHGQIVSDVELYTIWHIPNTDSSTVSSLKMVKFKKKPASQEMQSFPKEFYLDLGKSDFRMQEQAQIGIPTWDDMKKHLYILGGTGSGKSETLKTILNGILQKDGDHKPALLIIDPKNDFATDLLTMIPEERKDDVIYFNPSKQKERPLSFPFFAKFSGQKSDEERVGFLISIMKRFVQIDSESSWGPELENILRQLFQTAYFLPDQSLSGLDQLLHEPNQIKALLKYLPARLQNFWSDSILKRSSNELARYLATTNNKLGKFLDYQEFMNITDRLDSKISFEEMIHGGKIFIANLGSSSEQLKKYYAAYLTAHISEAIFGQANLPASERKPAVVVIDEFQRVAGDIFETLFSEVRAFNTSMVISNQFMGQLEPKIQKAIESNIATKIFMRTQSIGDAEIAEKILGEKVSVEDIINLPTGTAYIKTLVDGVPQEPMSFRIQKTEHPKDILRDTEEYFIKATESRYGTPLEVIKQKREASNSVYYSSQKSEVFKELMTKKVSFEATT